MKMTSVRSRVLMLVAGLGLLLPALDSRAEAPPLDVNARNFRKRVQVLGTIPYGTTTPTIVLRGLPRFRAFAFRGNANDPVEVWVRSPDGDPVAWLLNERFGVVADNDDANEGEQGALLQLTLPAPGTYYILFRDYDFAPASFTVSLQRGRAAPVCPPPLRWDPALGRCIGESAQICGGGTGRACPPGYQCQDDPRDRCDPRFGGRDCVGTCVPVVPGGEGGGCDPAGAASCTQYQSWDARACRCVDNASCGGWGGRPCPGGYQCVDDPRDACDPRYHGAHCNGMCVAQGGTVPSGCDPAGASRCAPYQTWDARACNCVDNPVCGGPSGRPCPSGYQCVDDPRDYCDPRRQGASCGGVCVAQGPGQVPGRCDPSGASRCTTYQTWEQDACQCVDNPGCGGFTGRPCPSGYQCIDDPRDDCDPRRGGADCGGVCVTSAPRRGGRCDPAGASSCAPYQTWDGQTCQCVDNQVCGRRGDPACPGGTRCFDDPRDGCDPRQGQVGCPGICL